MSAVRLREDTVGANYMAWEGLKELKWRRGRDDSWAQREQTGKVFCEIRAGIGRKGACLRGDIEQICPYIVRFGIQPVTIQLLRI